MPNSSKMLIHHGQLVFSSFLPVFVGKTRIFCCDPIDFDFFPIFAAKNVTFSNSLRVSQDALDAGGCAAGDQRLPFGDLRLQTRHGGRHSGGAGRRWQTAADFLRSQVNKKTGCV